MHRLSVIGAALAVAVLAEEAADIPELSDFTSKLFWKRPEQGKLFFPSDGVPVQATTRWTWVCQPRLAACE